MSTQSPTMAPPALDYVALTPLKSTPSPRKRKIIPSLELSSPKKTTIILKSGVLAPSPLIETADHHLLSPSKRILPKTIQATKLEDPSTADSRHIILDFNLHDEPEIFHSSRGKEALNKLFPTAEQISFDRSFLTIRFDELPAKPWPFTVAGVPSYFTTERGNSGPLGKLMQNRPRTNIRLLGEINAHGQTLGGSNVKVFDQHVHKVFEYFVEHDIKVVQLQNWNYIVVLVLQNKHHINEHIPKTIMSMTCSIVFQDEIAPSRQPALRLRDPQATNPPQLDDQPYDLLRPGVMVTSEEYAEGSLTSTSGVLVQKDSGPKLLTVAAHGFPKMGIVYHPKGHGRVIGEITKDFSPEFGIALVELAPHESFVNETFDSAEGEDGCELTSLVPLKELKIGDLLYMNNPFIGKCEAQIGSITYERCVLVEKQEESFWLQTGAFIWTGQGSTPRLPDGICGTAITNGEDRVVGFFRYVSSGPLQDFCYATAADNLIRKSYGICKG